MEDAELEAEVTRVFSRFGTVFVKIRRDNRKQMPFAFCQFTRDEDALTALEHGKGEWIFGRTCRTEKAKANCKCSINIVKSSPHTVQQPSLSSI